MPHLIPAPRPVPTREDRMTDARRTTFATYLDAHERDQLDARAATAEQERDDARDDRDNARAERDVYKAQVANLREQLGAATDALAAVRDARERIDRALAAYDAPGDLAAAPVPSRRAQEDPGQADILAAQRALADPAPSIPLDDVLARYVDAPPGPDPSPECSTSRPAVHASCDGCTCTCHAEATP